MARKKLLPDEERVEIRNRHGAISNIFGDGSGSESAKSEVDGLEVD